MEYKIILKCRICLDEFDEEEMFDLFAERKNSRGCSTLKLSEKVEYCCGVRIRESSEMPSKICMKCFDMTRIWYNFRQLCVNSQVYLESLCTDINHSKDVDDTDYFLFLYEDLQLFRSAARKKHSELEISGNQSSSENEDYDTSEEFYENFLNEADESDADLSQIVENIKNEQKDQDQEKENSPKPEVLRPRAKKRTNSLKKAPGSVPKKRYRPPSPSTYMCSICGNVYTKKASFQYHMSMHSNARPHECELCGKSFRQTSELKNHMRRHTGERPYKCSYCERHFIDRSEKHRHERVHTNTRPYICKICGKSFMYSAILKNHSKLHSGEKDFNCLVCHKAFTLQHQLKAHLQTITHKQKEAQFVGAGYEVIYTSKIS